MSLVTAYTEFKSLTTLEKEQLYHMIQKVILSSSFSIASPLNKIRESRFYNKVIWPNCKSEHVVGHGKYRDRQRYKCKACLITFNDLSLSPMAGTHYQNSGWSISNLCVKANQYHIYRKN